VWLRGGKGIDPGYQNSGNPGRDGGVWGREGPNDLPH